MMKRLKSILTTVLEDWYELNNRYSDIYFEKP